jgi:cardiolipin synthase
VIVASLLTYVLTTRVERERRPPAVAIAWVLGMVAVPYLSLPLYILFGRRKLQRHGPHRSTLPLGRHWAEDLSVSFGLPPASECRVRMHQDGAASRAALHEVIAAAESRLDLCTYILGRDLIGREVCAHLERRVRDGVRVRLMIDGVGAIQLPHTVFRDLAHAGVETAVFSPLLARRTSGPRNLRNHRKLVLADDARLWAGGRNFAAEYFVATRGRAAWCDLSFDLEGPVAAAAANQFEDDWVASHGKPATPLPATDLGSVDRTTGRGFGEHPTQFLPSGPDQTEDTVQAVLLDACFRAERRLVAVTPYFVPDASLNVALRLAARRGVKIDICLPASSNHILADFARSRTLRSLTEAGVTFHLLPYMVHAKGVVLDETLALCGSPNLDSRSLLLNYESAFLFYGTAEIDWLANWIDALIKDSVPYAAQPPALWRDVAEGLLLTVAYQL